MIVHFSLLKTAANLLEKKPPNGENFIKDRRNDFFVSPRNIEFQ